MQRLRSDDVSRSPAKAGHHVLPVPSQRMRKSRTPNPESQIPNPESRIRIPGSVLDDLRHRPIVLANLDAAQCARERDALLDDLIGDLHEHVDVLAVRVLQ